MKSHKKFSIATWNVNSLRVRLEQVMQWLQEYPADVLAIQETKIPDSEFPLNAFQSEGYHVVFSGQKTYNGVAIISRHAMDSIVTDIDCGFVDQHRVLIVTIGDLRICNVYVPNGGSVDSEKYDFKLNWLRQLAIYLQQELQRYANIIVLGDVNITPDDRDVHDPALWRGQILCSEPERAELRKIYALGFQDVFRLFEQPEKSFSWWDYRALAFRRNHGLRIDLILASEALTKRCSACIIDKQARKAERPSDHAPVIAYFEEK